MAEERNEHILSDEETGEVNGGFHTSPSPSVNYWDNRTNGTALKKNAGAVPGTVANTTGVPGDMTVSIADDLVGTGGMRT